MAVLTDPVCGMVVHDLAIRAEGRDDLAFCSEVCKETFEAATARFGPWQPSPSRWSERDHPSAPADPPAA